MRGGMFRSRRKFDEKREEKEKFVFHQLIIGFQMSIDEFKFVITDIDDKTIKFMIQNPREVNMKNLYELKKMYNPFSFHTVIWTR